jgi:hypothetical protein
MEPQTTGVFTGTERNKRSKRIGRTRGLELWCLMPLSTIFSNIMPVSFIGGGNQSTRKKTSTYCKSFIT